jgi:Fic family protein
VHVAKYVGPPWDECEYLVDRLCQWLNEGFTPPDSSLSTAWAVLRAVMAHLYIAWIHPFGDGNGRTARLAEFQIMLAGRAPSVAAHLLSNFYNQTRTEYYRRLDLASKRPEGVLDFLSYAIAGLKDSLDEQIDIIRNYQWDISWRDYVYQQFRGQKGGSVERRRLIALSLLQCEGFKCNLSKLKTLTPEIAIHYARKTSKTLSRDINELLQMKLIKKEGKSIELNLSQLLQLLPQRRRPDK